ncbi:MAG: MBL fold metallo-hydrolase [Eubacteriales bacterium]|nr:MBL fold metallo-hydrolase [Eubacteriales bacterium]
MKITYLGHSCFKVESGDCSIILDPYKNGKVPGLGNLNEKANIVLCSHGHDDHNAKELIKKIDYVSSPFQVDYITAYHDESKGQKRGETKVYSINAEGYTIVHMGDIGCMLDAKQIEKIYAPDVLMIPVGGVYTVDADEAFEIVKALNPKTVIPMHYRKENVGFEEIATSEEFLSKFNIKDITYTDSEYILNHDKSFVVVMPPKYII